MACACGSYLKNLQQLRATAHGSSVLAITRSLVMPVGIQNAHCTKFYNVLNKFICTIDVCITMPCTGLLHILNG